MKTSGVSSSELERAFQTVLLGVTQRFSFPIPDYDLSLGLVDRALRAHAARCFANMNWTKSPELVDDAVQCWHWKMLFSGYRRYLETHDGRPFSPYGMEALRNMCSSIRRDGCKLVLTDEIEEPSSAELCPLGMAQTDEIHQLVRDEVAHLPQAMRDVLVLTVWFGLSSQEVANRLGISVNAVNMRNHRSRLLLRDRLATILLG